MSVPAVKYSSNVHHIHDLNVPRHQLSYKIRSYFFSCLIHSDAQLLNAHSARKSKVSVGFPQLK